MNWNPYVIVPLPVFDAPGLVAKVVVPLDVLEVLDGSDEWVWHPREGDAYVKGRHGWVEHSLRNRARLYGDVLMNPTGVWDMRGCSRSPHVEGGGGGCELAKGMSQLAL